MLWDKFGNSALRYPWDCQLLFFFYCNCCDTCFSSMGLSTTIFSFTVVAMMLALATIAMEYMNPLYYSNHTDCMYFKTSCNVAMYPRSSLAQGLGRAISWRLSWRQVLIITPTFLFGPQDWKPEELPWVEKKNGHSRIVLKISQRATARFINIWGSWST